MCQYQDNKIDLKTKQSSFCSNKKIDWFVPIWRAFDKCWNRKREKNKAKKKEARFTFVYELVEFDIFAMKSSEIRANQAETKLIYESEKWKQNVDHVHGCDLTLTAMRVKQRRDGRERRPTHVCVYGQRRHTKSSQFEIWKIKKQTKIQWLEW